MYYFYPILVTHGTTIDQPVHTVCQIESGTIDYIEVEYPKGCVGLVKAKVLVHAHQLLPWNPSEWLYGDDRVFHIDANESVLAPPYEIEVISYNEDDTYDHQLSVVLNVIRSVQQGISQVYTVDNL